MSIKSKKLSQSRVKRAQRVRKSLRGSAEKPRLCVVKSNKHIQVQVIDDSQHRTLFGLSTFSKSMSGTEAKGRNKSSAKIIGEKVAELAKERQIEQMVFDRGRHRYHGILVELAEAVRSNGIQI